MDRSTLDCIRWCTLGSCTGVITRSSARRFYIFISSIRSSISCTFLSHVILSFVLSLSAAIPCPICLPLHSSHTHTDIDETLIRFAWFALANYFITFTILTQSMYVFSMTGITGIGH